MRRALAMTWRTRRSLRRLVAGVLVVLVALGAAMPAWARLVAGPAEHACHCETRGGHAHCACPLCFPELREVETFGAPSVSGKCGTDDPGWRAHANPAVIASDFVLAASLAHLTVPDAPILPPPLWSEPPEPPPPRSALSRTTV
ncbi:MAG: hypothetical protein KF819_37335 [Labilithrix sp.]|nr:hypothetical protein [Labilithrix sp.]